MPVRLLLTLLILCSAVAAQKAPVVLITVEGLGWNDLNNPQAPVPHLSRMLKESVVLRDFHVSPLDAPSRAALLTGLEPARAGVWGNHSGRNRLRGEVTTLAAYLKNAGYSTGLFGTWALGDTVPSRPQDHGYSRVLTHGGGLPGSAADAFSNDGQDDIWLLDGEAVVRPGTWTGAAFAAARAFVGENAGKPFLCHLAPSEPAGMPEEQVQPFRGQPGFANPVRAAWLAELDAALGSFLEHLETTGRAAQTIVILTSTGGAPAESAANSPEAGRRGQRRSPYEGGHCVPLLVRWPGGLTAREVSVPAMHYDLLPTLAALTGTPLPADARLDGISLAPWLTDAAAAPPAPERVLITDAQEVPVPVLWRRQCVMSGPWRLIHGRELYNLQDDPGQQRNLAAVHPGTVARLRGAAEDWWQRLAPDKLEPVRAVVGGVQDPVLLTAHDWLARGGAAISRDAIIAGTPANGQWALHIAFAGHYDILLRRWPLTVNRALHDSFFTPDKARLRLGAHDETKPVPAGASGVNFRVALKPGPVTLQTWFTGSGKSSGAYFVELRRAVEVRAAKPVPEPR